MTDAPKPGDRREGSLEAPFRHPIAWQDPEFYDLASVEAELERVFDICHGCRRCFNLCDSFPRLFDLVDDGPTGEIDGVAKADYEKVTEACTLCDMCFMTKCPYVPPHEWNVDFPHLMLRHRAAMRKAEGGEFVREQLGKTDRNGTLAKPVAGLANWATKLENKAMRGLLEDVAGVDREALLPRYHHKSAGDRLTPMPEPDPEGPSFGKRKAAIYATCFVEYNEPDTAVAAAYVLAKQGVEMRFAYPLCCGMPQLEAGDIADVARRAEQVCAELLPLVDDGYDIVTLTASCGLMMKFEWPLILPNHEGIKRLAAATRDISEYIVDLSRDYGIAPGLSEAKDEGITLHHACHARAQNMGAKSAQMLALIPGAKVDLIERCSGHGGTFGVMKETRDVAVKVGKPTARQVVQKGNETLCSDCPLACKHLGQLVSAQVGKEGPAPKQAHPIEVLASAYGFKG
jgi:glycerol-3-phosphate dehydrogenase subunit C